MIRNYFTVTIRNIRRNLSYSLINVSGLALGITCSFILFLLINFFTSFDKHHPAGDRIYRLTTVRQNNGQYDYQPGVYPVLPEALRADVNGLQDVLFISNWGGDLITVEFNGTKKLFEEEEGIAFTESNYFNFFNRKLLSGSLKGLDRPNQGLISKKLARKYFGDQNPLGKSIIMGNQYEINIIGVIDDVPANTNFPFELILSYQTIYETKQSYGWRSVDSEDQCYVILNEHTTRESVVRQLPQFILTHMGEEQAARTTMDLQPLEDLMYNEQFSNYRYRTVSRESLWAMGVVGIFLLITACINFVNLSTAVAVRRSREVGIRKVMGGDRLQLMVQFLCETALITLVALLASIGLAELGLIKLNAFLETDLHFSFGNKTQLLFITGVWILVSIASGLYPALLLSGFSPAAALKNKMSAKGTGGYSLRRTLVVFQFVISQVLIVGTIIMMAQMNYFESKDLGFKRDAIVTIPLYESDNIAKKKVLKKEVDRLPGVQQSSLCIDAPSSQSTYNTRIRIDGGAEEGYRTQTKRVDGEYIDMFGIEVIAGTKLPDLDTATGWMVNEKLVDVLGVGQPEDLVGKDISMGRRTLPVLGVVKNFHTVSLTEEIYPTMLFNGAYDYETLSVRLKGNEFSTTIAAIEKLWYAQYPGYLFNYEFLDDTIRQFYDREQKMSSLLILFSIIAIVIGCLGLYGLVSFMANEKEKEIGVRKVMGATTQQIMIIFSRELVLLVFISFLIASPLAGYVMNNWLQNFAYHIDLDWTMFATGVVITMFIAFATVSYRTIKAARTNPAETLRSE